MNLTSMFKTMIKGLLAVILSIMLAMIMPMQSYAMEAQSASLSPRYAYITSCSVDLSISNGTATITASLTGQKDVTSSNIKCNLEKLTGSTYWMQIQSFWASGTNSANLNTTYGVSSGTYRVVGHFTCNTETATVYSGNRTY